jgi:drug/metabolite transporter (DMT)-like permease
MHFPWYYHVAGLISGISSAIAYITVGKLNKYYDARVIVAAFIISGVLFPSVSMLVHYFGEFNADEIFIVAFKWPQAIEWGYIILLGLAALFGQYFVTKAYGADKAGIVSAVSYANIVFSVFIGMMLGDAFPDAMSLSGIGCIIVSGVIVSLVKKRMD